MRVPFNDRGERIRRVAKVGVREEVLVKPKKPPPLLMERVQARFAFIRRTLEREHFRAQALAAERGERLAEAGVEARMAELERVRALVMEARDGLLDTDLVETMVENGVYRRMLEVDWWAL